jgi:hypothetical protein
MTTLTRWLLRALADKWPVGTAGTYADGALLSDSDPGGPLWLEDRDDSMILEVDTSTDPTTLARTRPARSHDLSAGGVIGVALTADDDQPAGLGGDEYRLTPVLSVRIEAATEWEAENGLASAAVFMEDVVREAKQAVKGIDNGTLQSAPVADFHVVDPGTTNPQLDETHSRWQYQFDVEPRGYQQL